MGLGITEFGKVSLTKNVIQVSTRNVKDGGIWSDGESTRSLPPRLPSY
jgi:hypothetical protein